MFRPDLHRLAVFCAVVDDGSLSQASRRLFMSQPAISAHIKSLQEQLGLKLFHRVGRRSVVSRAGEVLYRSAGDLLAQADELRTLMSSLNGTDQGRLHVGMSLEWEPLLPQALGRYKRTWPYTEVLLTVDTCAGVEKLRLDRHFDLGSIARAALSDGLKSLRLANDEIVPVAVSDHPLARRGLVQPTDLQSEMIFVRESGSTSRDVTDDLLDKFGLRSRIALEAASFQTLTASVAEASGIGMLPSSSLEVDGRKERFAVLDIPELMAPISLHVVYLQDRKRSEALARFLEIVCQSNLWADTTPPLAQSGPDEAGVNGLPVGAVRE